MILDFLNHREKPGPIALKVRSASVDDVMGDFARVHIDHRPFSRAGGVIVIRQDKSKAKVRLVARGLSRGMKKGEIAMDSASRQRLQIKQGQTYNFTFEEAGWWDGLLWAWHATDAMPRIAARLGVVSVGLGLVGAILGGWSLYLTLAPATP